MMHTLPPITDAQLQALAGLIDAGVRATGLRAVKEAAELMAWLESATPMEGPKPLPENEEAA